VPNCQIIVKPLKHLERRLGVTPSRAYGILSKCWLYDVAVAELGRNCVKSSIPSFFDTRIHVPQIVCQIGRFVGVYHALILTWHVPRPSLKDDLMTYSRQASKKL
jgi:hypothetical protein